MNAAFCLLFVISACVLLVRAPDAFLPALLRGAEKAGTLCLVLLASYAVWLGFFGWVTDSGLDKRAARLFRPVLTRLFRTRNADALSALTFNLTANLLGVGGAATPMGVRAAQLLSAEPTGERDSAMLFLLNATSLQLLPTTVLSLRLAYGSANASDILLPTLLTSACSTLLGILSVFLCYRRRA